MFKVFQTHEEFSEQYEHVEIQYATLASFYKNDVGWVPLYLNTLNNSVKLNITLSNQTCLSDSKNV